MRVIESKREAILNGAIKAFAKKGYHSCTTRDIANEAGVGYGSLYHYFKSKDKILLTIFQERWDLFLSRIDKITKRTSDPLEQLLGVFDFVLESYQKNPNVMRVLVIGVPLLKQFYTKKNLELYFHQFLLALMNIIIDGQKKGLFRKSTLPQFVSVMIQGTIDMMVRQQVYNPSFPEILSVETAREQFKEMLIRILLVSSDT